MVFRPEPPNGSWPVATNNHTFARSSLVKKSTISSLGAGSRLQGSARLFTRHPTSRPWTIFQRPTRDCATMWQRGSQSTSIEACRKRPILSCTNSRTADISRPPMLAWTYLMHYPRTASYDNCERALFTCRGSAGCSVSCANLHRLASAPLVAQVDTCSARQNVFCDSVPSQALPRD